MQDDPRFLPRPDAPPVAWVAPWVVHEKLNQPTGTVRHFKCIRVGSWRREVGVSEFLHFAIQGRTLYVEQTVCQLLPIKRSYHLIDDLHGVAEDSRAVTAIVEAARSLIDAVQRLL